MFTKYGTKYGYTDETPYETRRHSGHHWQYPATTSEASLASLPLLRSTDRNTVFQNSDTKHTSDLDACQISPSTKCRY
jgi:hypothetical protein